MRCVSRFSAASGLILREAAPWQVGIAVGVMYDAAGAVEDHRRTVHREIAQLSGGIGEAASGSVTLAVHAARLGTPA